MARVIVVRTGGTWYGEGDKKPSGLQSQDNHTAVARALCAGGHDVLCCGRIEGSLSFHNRHYTASQAGTWEQLSWAIKPSLGIAGNEDERIRVRNAVRDFKPDVVVNVCGSELTTLSPVTAKARGIETIDASWRYGWMLVEIMDELRLPRICVITDCRCYPRESELSLFDYMRPAAVLSQERKSFERSSAGGGLWRVESCYAGIERLRLTGIKPLPPSAWTVINERCIALAHAHVDDAVISKHKRQLWAYIGGEGAPLIDAYGNGWDNFEGAPKLGKDKGERYSLGNICPKGELAHGDDMYRALSTYTCGPLVPMCHGWLSPKYREYALAGCVPLPYGRGELLTYDYSEVLGDGHCIPIGAQTRFCTPQELNELLARCVADHDFRADQIELALSRSEPDPTTLLNCVESFRAGFKTDVYGGYTHVAVH